MARGGSKAVSKSEAAEAGVASAGGKRKLLLIGAVALIGLGGAGAFLVGGSKPEAEAAKAPEKKVVAFVDLKEMMVNLAPAPGSDRAQFLKLRVALEVADVRLVADITPLIPRVEDAFQVYLRELRVSDLEGSAGVYRLKEELLRRVNHAVQPVRVEAVLFKDVLIQ